MDTNSVIYFFNGEEPISKLIKEAENSISISFITKIELLCFETENDLIDLFFKSLLCAEIRFISRYIPQRSNEERLIGNLVSELDNSICLVKDEFKDFSIKRYSEPKEVDFFYFDLSRGDKVEKHVKKLIAALIKRRK